MNFLIRTGFLLQASLTTNYRRKQTTDALRLLKRHITTTVTTRKGNQNAELQIIQ